MQQSTPSTTEHFFGESKLAELMRQYAWGNSSLGAVDTWPSSLLTAININLNSSFAMTTLWGPELLLFYNDGYIPILGKNHPQALGRPCAEAFQEAWATAGPLLNGIFTTRQAVSANNLLLFMGRNGYTEECYFNFCYSPLYDETKTVVGVSVVASETTAQVLSARRLKTLHALSMQVSRMQQVAELSKAAMQSLAHNLLDIPFALLYRLDKSPATLVGTSGIAYDSADEQQAQWPIAEVVKTQQPVLVENLKQFANLPTGGWAIPPKTALLLPLIEASSQTIIAILIVGINPHKKLDDSYTEFFELLAKQFSSLLTDALAYEQECKKTQVLTEIDRAKTAFFSNITHELRTPLTLMLAPIADSLADTQNPLPIVQQQRQQMIQRNAQRLLKLVNSLLDFARIEADRMQARYEPINLAEFTLDLASMFRSAFEKAKLNLILDLPTLAAAVYVDKEMWEKIIFNLLSNALKYTLQGEVKVKLAIISGQVVLTVTDTGIGIAEQALPHIFERFYRVEQAQGRSHEGTGIGLALTQALVKLHSGTLQLTSTLGSGSTFTLCLPLGKAHLPQAQMGEATPATTVSKVGQLFVKESLGWLGEQTNTFNISTENLLPIKNPHICILVVDDNADMRQYIKNLLAPHAQIITADNGETALTVLRTQKIDLILTDVMMPKIDGFALLKILQREQLLAAIPIIMLSARAGEEARIEGLAAGATDYLVKPFSAKELLARVHKQLELLQQRQQLQQQVVLTNDLEKAKLHKKLQEEFIDTVCHEIRNPLNGIYGCVDGLSHTITQLESLLAKHDKAITWEIGNGIAQQMGNLKEVQENLSVCATQQKVIVDDVLDLSKLENNKLTLQAEPFNPRQAILNAAKMFHLPLSQKKLTLAFELAEDFYIKSDLGRFTQVVINLLSNAIKFTPQGIITIKLDQTVLANQQAIITVSVQDSGIGMTADEVSRLFEPFFQATHKTTNQFSGTGLGLTISKKLVTMMQGDITVNSAKGYGTTFTFTIKAPFTAAPKKKLSSSPQLPTTLSAAKHVLIVEDNTINQKVLARQLQQAGHTYQIANNGLEGLRCYQENNFDLILMDIEMPVMNGLEATRQIRQHEQQQNQPPITIIGLSGNAREEQITQGRQAGMNDYMTKPFHKETLLKHVNQAISPRKVAVAKNIKEGAFIKPPSLLTSPNFLPTREGFFAPVLKHEQAYLLDLQRLAKKLLRQVQLFAIYPDNQQLTIQLIPQVPALPALYGELLIKELKAKLKLAFSTLAFKQLARTATHLTIQMHTTAQLELLQCVLLNAGFTQIPQAVAHCGPTQV